MAEKIWCPHCSEYPMSPEWIADKARLAAAERDAARYRWLREEPKRLRLMFKEAVDAWFCDESVRTACDEAIDAAMTADSAVDVHSNPAEPMQVAADVHSLPLPKNPTD